MHRTANVNEYSTRYSEAIDACQETPSNQWRLQSKDNKQGSSGFLEKYPEGFGINYNPNEFPVPRPADYENPGDYLSARERYFQEEARDLYEERLKLGIAKEQARKDLPLSNYTMAYWKCDLHNLFHFLKLRLDPHAQLEIRSYAHVIAGIVKELFPICFEAFYDYNLNMSSFSLQEMRLLNALQKCCKNDGFNEDDIRLECNRYNLSNRETDEFVKKYFGVKETKIEFNAETHERINVSD